MAEEIGDVPKSDDVGRNYCVREFDKALLER